MCFCGHIRSWIKRPKDNLMLFLKHIVFETASLTEIELAKYTSLAGQQALVSSCLHIPNPGIKAWTAQHLFIYIDAGPGNCTLVLKLAKFIGCLPSL